MTSKIAHQRCKNHSEREAYVKCPQCGYFYCSECCVESDGRFLCSNCLEKHDQKKAGKKKSLFRNVLTICGVLICFMSIWMILIFSGELLLVMPDTWIDNGSKDDSTRVAR